MILHRPPRNRPGSIRSDFYDQARNHGWFFRESLRSLDDLCGQWRVALRFTHGISLSGVGDGANKGSPTP